MNAFFKENSNAKQLGQHLIITRETKCAKDASHWSVVSDVELPKWSQVTAKAGVRWNLYIKYKLYISLSLISCSVSAVSLEKGKSVHVFSTLSSHFMGMLVDYWDSSWLI